VALFIITHISSLACLFCPGYDSLVDHFMVLYFVNEHSLFVGQ